jgi:ribosomal protein S19E (S16A)
MRQVLQMRRQIHRHVVDPTTDKVGWAARLRGGRRITGKGRSGYLYGAAL